MGYSEQIRNEYRGRRRDSTGLFKIILSVADDIGMDQALEILEECVNEKWQEWLDKRLPSMPRSGDPLKDGYSILFEEFIGRSKGKDGVEVVSSDRKLMMRWTFNCHILEACMELGLDTREICKKVYNRPSQEFLSRIDPRLRFDRNYEELRPYGPYCEEIITLERVV